MAKMGRPYKFKTIEEFEKKADEYFENTKEGEYTITGLALYLSTTREVLADYESGKYDQHFDEGVNFSDTIKKAKQIVQNDYEKTLRKRGNAGDIFGLKNFNWTDKQEVDMKHSGELDLGGVFNDKKRDN